MNPDSDIKSEILRLSTSTPLIKFSGPVNDVGIPASASTYPSNENVPKSVSMNVRPCNATRASEPTKPTWTIPFSIPYASAGFVKSLSAWKKSSPTTSS